MPVRSKAAKTRAYIVEGAIIPVFLGRNRQDDAVRPAPTRGGAASPQNAKLR
jgi:hypothetical protein